MNVINPSTRNNKNTTAAATGNSCTEVDCTSSALPDACGNDERQERLLERQEGTIFEKEQQLLVAGVILIVLMNINTGRYVLYPFKIFSTWIHEMCHGMAAILTGGGIQKLEIFQDGSGLAYTWSPHSTIVSSAGYPGTAVTGCLLLLVRRNTLGPTIGTIGLGVAMLLSCAFFVRNKFGLILLPIEGVVLLLLGWKLPAAWLDMLYSFLALTVSLNAVENIQDLYSFEDGTDAHTVAKTWPGDARVWSTVWLVMSLVLTTIGIVLARDARALPWSRLNDNKTTHSETTVATTSTTPLVKINNSQPVSNKTNSVWTGRLLSGGTPMWRSPEPTPSYVAHVV